MDEQNNNQNNYSYTPGVKHYWKECLGMMIAAFLGGFLAIYFVADQVFDKHNQPKQYAPERFERRMMNDFNKMYERERKAFERDFGNFDMDFGYDINKNLSQQIEKDFNRIEEQNKKAFDKMFGNKTIKKMPKSAVNPFLLPDMTMDSVKIKTELENNKYKVVIGLKPFQNDESKINYNVSGRKLTVFGSSKVKDKKYEQDISFSHDFILPLNSDIANISKKKDGNNLIIEVPLKD